MIFLLTSMPGSVYNDQVLLSSGSLLAEDLNKWHFSSTTSTKENIIFTVLICP